TRITDASPGSAFPWSTGTSSDCSRRPPCRRLCGSARAAASRERSCSTRLSSRSCSRSRALESRLPSSRRSPGSSSIATGSARFGSTSSGNRWTWWGQAWRAFLNHPGGGTGAGTFALTSTVDAHNSLQTTVEPHNTPLQFLSETGIVGFLVYAGTIASVVVAFVRGPRDRASASLGLAALVALVHSVID